MREKKRIFLLKPYKPQQDGHFTKKVKKFLEEIGFIVEKDDDISKSTNILNDILDGIRRSDLIIADLTDQNPNVLFELGIAYQMKKNIIQIARNDQELPFDVSQIRTIFYTTDEEGLKRFTVELKKFIDSYTIERIINDHINEFEESRSYQEAIEYARTLIDFEMDITKEQLINIAKAIKKNDQLYNSYRVREILRSLFSKQTLLLPEDLREYLNSSGWIQ